MDYSSVLLPAIGGAIGGGLGSLVGSKIENKGVRSGVMAGFVVVCIQLIPLTPLKGFLDVHLFKKSKFEIISSKASTQLMNDPVILKKLESIPKEQWTKFAFQASHDGMYLLDSEHLDKWNEFRLKLAGQSLKLCVSFLRGGMDMAELAKNFEPMSEAEINQWFDISILAARKGIELGKTYTDSAPRTDFLTHLPRVIAMNGPEEEIKLKEGLKNYMLSEDNDACWVVKRLHENAKMLEPKARHAFLRGMAAL
ncbi:hypothetical protein [Bdellovibrio sp. HCB209]|uniref:hypothetical protein n=1 Tax=Bdellovibrio sp. HCB209 TaxID=3394354 RepID=UPI0039B43124